MSPVVRILSLFLIAGQSFSLPLNRTSVLHDLLKYLFADYDRNVQPSRNILSPVPIKVTTFFYNLLSVDEVRNVVSMSGELDFLWHDEFLVWNETEFRAITEVYVPANKVWLPEMSLFENSKGALTSDPFGKVELKADGHVEYRTPFLFEILCGINPRYFPWDRQNCTFRYAPANGYTNEFEIISATGPVLESFVNHDEWEIVESRSDAVRRSVSAYDVLPDSNDFRSYIQYTLIMERRPEFYIYTLVVPSFVLTFGAIISIFAPFDARGRRRSKAKDGISAFLVLLMLQATVANKLPQTALVWPLLNIYFFGLIVIISSAMGIGTLIIWFEQRPVRKLPPWAHELFVKRLGSMLPFVLQVKANEHKIDLSTLLLYFIRNQVPIVKDEKESGNDDDSLRSENANNNDKDPLRRLAATVTQLCGNWSMVQEHVTNVMKKEAEKADWMNFLFVVERVCFLFFLFLLCFMVFLLFCHDFWY